MIKETRIDRYRLTPEGLLMAWAVTCDEAGGKLTIGKGFRLATQGKGFLQFILACICVAVCVPIGIMWRLAKRG